MVLFEKISLLAILVAFYFKIGLKFGIPTILGIWIFIWFVSPNFMEHKSSKAEMIQMYNDIVPVL